MDSRTEIISQIVRRRRWPVEDKVRLLELVMQPGASLAAIADRHGVSRSLLFLWRKQAQSPLPDRSRSRSCPSPRLTGRP